MSAHERSPVWPEIARLPGEPKLEGVPHLRRESIFSEPGVVDALELCDTTVELNSGQRRPIIEHTVGQLLRNPSTAEEVIQGLDTLSNPEVMKSPQRRLNASFIKSLLEDRLQPDSDKDSARTVDTPQPSEHPAFTMDGSWSYALLDRQVPSIDRSRMKKDAFLKHQVAKLVHRDEINTKEIQETGVQLFNRYGAPSGTLEELCLIFEDLAYAIDGVKQNTTSRRASTVVSNRIIAAAGSALAAKLPIEQSSFDLLSKLKDHSAAQGWMHPKWSGVEMQLDQRRQLADFAKRMQRAESHFTSLLEAHEESLPEQVTAAMERIHTLRRYGIKPAFFRDGIMHCSEDSWVVLDPQDSIEARMDGYENPELAIIRLAHAKNIDDIRGDDQLVETGKEGRAVGTTLPYNIHFGLSMLSDGELTLETSRGVISVRKEFEALGVRNTYEWLRFSHAMRIIDLTVPNTMTETMPRIKTPRTKLGGVLNMARFMGSPKIMLPRLKLINQDYEHVESALQEEQAAMEEETRRRLRHHPVTGHVRRLLPGYSASPEAREEARRAGILLADNETWVRKHTRGDENVGTIKAHQGIRQS